MSLTAPSGISTDPVEITDVPKSVKDKLRRGRDRMRDLAPDRNLCFRFWRNEQYTYVNKDRYLVAQSTVLDGDTKPRHRMRTVHNLLTDAVEHEVSAATQRVPAYQCVPSNIDPSSVGAAKMAEKVARFGYDKWRIRNMREKTVTNCVVGGEGFAWPYFDPMLNFPQGEICVRTFGPNEVYWEPGIEFEESRWHAVEQARSVDEIQGLPGFLGGKLKADAQTSDVLTDTQKQQNLVLVTEYLERPSPMRPDGLRLTLANGRVVLPAEPYPCMDGAGKVVDEPVLHYLTRIIDPTSDRGMGLVQFCIDPQRTHNDCWNKQLEWKNLALNPQVLMPIGSIKTTLTDEPGKVIPYMPVGGQVPQWRPVPNIPAELEQIKQDAAEEIRRIFAQNDIPSQVSAARAIQAVIDRDENRHAAFMARVAEWDSRLMRHCIWLVQRYYTEPRLLKIRGQWGPENLDDFTGADLQGQADIQVLPASIEPRTKEGIEQRVMNYAQLGWLDPQQAMEAIENGSAESLIDSYELDISRANRVIQRIMKGPGALFAGRPTDPGAADPNTPMSPDWMPRPFDNIPVQKGVFADFMKTSEYDTLEDGMKQATLLYYQALEQIEAQKAQEAAMAQANQAEQMGMNNAAKPADTSKPLPSLPAVNNGPS